MSIRIRYEYKRGYVLRVDGEDFLTSFDFQFLADCAASLISGAALVLNH